MSTRMHWGVAAALVLVLIAGLALITSLQAGRQPKTITISETRAGGAVALQVDDMLQVNLESNPSTGYHWSLKGLEATPLKLVGEPEFRPVSSALGASGSVTYQFEAVSAGQTTLALSYARSFDKDVFPLKTFMISVLVTAP